MTAGLYATAVWSAVHSALQARGRPISPYNTASLGQWFGPVVHLHRRPTAFSELSWSGLLRLLLAPHVPDPEWCRFCGLRHPCHSLLSFSARQSNLCEESISRPADYAPCANLYGEEICPASLCFQVHWQICILICALLYWSLSSTIPSAPAEWWHPSTTTRAPSPASCHFLSAPGDSASSLLGRLRQSSRLPLQECLAWEFDISFCRGVQSPRARNKSFADLRSCASLLWRLLLLRPHILLEGPGYVAMWCQNDGIHRRRHEHQARPFATFYQHLGIVPHPF